MWINGVGNESRLYRAIPVLAFIAGCFCIATPALAAVQATPCSTNSASRQLDYWLGNWDLTSPGNSASTTSNVSLALDECMILESWNGNRNHQGKNMLAYSADDKAWHGMFADNEGRVHVFAGNVASGVAEFHGPSLNPNGQTALNRIRIVRVNRDHVEQTWEKSTDNGVTWTMEFRGEYSRRKM